jgi:hypothetical protein
MVVPFAVVPTDEAKAKAALCTVPLLLDEQPLYLANEGYDVVRKPHPTNPNPSYTQCLQRPVLPLEQNVSG